ncbi:MAG: phosphodiester glycosidase family protein [Chloroflexaceae bacterium]|nr:phosphodiester glycosidase family protein [Chloroflexaceae bacterium]
MASRISRRTLLKLALASGGTAALASTGLLAGLPHLPVAGFLHPAVQTFVAQAYAAPAGLVFSQETLAIGPGISLTTTGRVDASGWLRDYVLTVDLATPTLTTDLIFPGRVAATAPLSTLANSAGAVAAINGDFFDINTTGAPIGAAIQNGRMLKSAQGDGFNWHYAGVDDEGIGHLLQLVVVGQLESNVLSGPRLITFINTAEVLNDAIGLYTPLWSDRAISVSFPGASQLRLVTVVQGSVAAVSTAVTEVGRAVLPAPPADGFLLVGREQGAVTLDALIPGTPVTVNITPTITPPVPPRFAVGGNIVLVQHGALANDLDTRDIAARSAVGFSADGRRMLLATIDGKQTLSHGASLQELGQFMLALGAYNAMNLDGGGSAMLAARRPGFGSATLINRPSDGGERPIPNAIGLFVAPGSGQLRTLVLAPAHAYLNSNQVFPNLARTLDLRGHDEQFSAVEVRTAQWQVQPAGTVQANILRASGEAGMLQVQASSSGVTGHCDLRLLKPLARIESFPPRLTLVADASATFRLVGYDEDGYSATLDPLDVQLTFDTSLVSMLPTEQGEFAVQARSDSGANLVMIRVGDVETFLPVTVGLQEVVVSTLESMEDWTAATARAQATMALAAGRQGNGLKLSYDFSGTCPGCSTGTRAAYLRTSQPLPFLELPGQPVRIGVWVKSSSPAMPWLRLSIRHAANLGVDTNLDLTADYDPNFGTEWRYVEATVPSGLQFPLYLRHIYVVETAASRVYTGEVTFDDITVKVAPPLEVPRRRSQPDPVVITNGTIETERWRFALVSDTHLYQTTTPSVEEQLSRQIFQQVRAAQPDFLVIAGDLIENGTAEDIAFAKRVLAEEFGETPPFPIYVIPGNHELRPQTTGTIEAYVNGGFTTRTIFDHKRVRFILLNTANALLHRPEFDQLPELQAALLDAQTNPAIENVVVIGHHPTFDPLPPNTRTLNHPLDIELLNSWMRRFREQSGKGIIYHCGHAHYVNLRRSDGVLHVIGPAAGKVPYGEPDNGGFNGWMLYGVQPGIAADWMQVEVRPVLERAELVLPERMRVGEQVTVTATGFQVRNRQLPLRYPVTSMWSGDNVTIGQPSSASATAAVTYDPETNLLTALAPGNATLRLTVNGVQVARSLVVEAVAQPAPEPAPRRVFLPLVNR